MVASKHHEVMDFCWDTPFMSLMGTKHSFMTSEGFEVTVPIKGWGFLYSKEILI